MIRRITFCTCLVAAFSTVACAAEIAVQNGSFTNVAANGFATGWTIGPEAIRNVTVARDASVFKSAPASLRLATISGGHTEGFASTLIAPGVVKTKGTIKGWSKMEGSGVFNVVIQVFVGEESVWNHLGEVGRPEWTEFSIDFDLSSQFGASKPQFVLLSFFLGGGEVAPSGKFWIDDVQILMGGSVVPVEHLAASAPLDHRRIDYSINPVDARGRAMPVVVQSTPDRSGAGVAALRFAPGSALMPLLRVAQ